MYFFGWLIWSFYKYLQISVPPHHRLRRVQRVCTGVTTLGKIEMGKLYLCFNNIVDGSILATAM